MATAALTSASAKFATFDGLRAARSDRSTVVASAAPTAGASPSLGRVQATATRLRECVPASLVRMSRVHGCRPQPVQAPAAGAAKRSKVEIYKEESDYLRYPLIDDLKNDLPNVSAASEQVRQRRLRAGASALPRIRRASRSSAPCLPFLVRIRALSVLPTALPPLIKFHGSYMQDDREARQGGGGRAYQFMMRTRQPGGKVHNRLYLAMDGPRRPVRLRHAPPHHAPDLPGALRLTTRQTFELHGVLKANLKEVFATVIKSMGSTLGACGDLNRNVLAPEVPFVDRPAYRYCQEYADKIAALLEPQSGAYYDVWLDGEKVLTAEAPADVEEARADNRFGTNIEGSAEPIYGTQYLPRKFKVAITVPGDNSVDLLTNDLGLVVLCDDATGQLQGFNIYVSTVLRAPQGGRVGVLNSCAGRGAAGIGAHSWNGMGPRWAAAWGGRTATSRRSRGWPEPLGYVAAEDVLYAVKAIVATQRDYGRRDDRKQARLKYLIRDWGIDRFRTVTEQYFGKQFPALCARLAVLTPSPAPPHPPSVLSLAHYRVGDGRLYYGLHIENGRIKGEAKKALRAVIEKYNLPVRISANQNLMLCDVRKAWRPRITQELAAVGILGKQYVDPLNLTAMACPALPLCGLAITEAERGLPSVLKRIRAMLDKVGEGDAAVGLRQQQAHSLVVRMTGCPNGCARPYVAELGFVGDGANSYQLWLGGTPNQTVLARVFLERVKVGELEAVLEPLFAMWKAHGHKAESFGDFTNRVVSAAAGGFEAMKEYMGTYTAPIGRQRGMARRITVDDELAGKLQEVATQRGTTVAKVTPSGTMEKRRPVRCSHALRVCTIMWCCRHSRQQNALVAPAHTHAIMKAVAINRLYAWSPPHSDPPLTRHAARPLACPPIIIPLPVCCGSSSQEGETWASVAHGHMLPNPEWGMGGEGPLAWPASHSPLSPRPASKDFPFSVPLVRPSARVNPHPRRPCHPRIPSVRHDERQSGGGGGRPQVDKAADFANYFCTYAYLYHQKDMLSDRVRMNAYRDAVMKNKAHFVDKQLSPSSPPPPSFLAPHPPTPRALPPHLLPVLAVPTLPVLACPRSPRNAATTIPGTLKPCHLCAPHPLRPHKLFRAASRPIRHLLSLPNPSPPTTVLPRAPQVVLDVARATRHSRHLGGAGGRAAACTPVEATDMAQHAETLARANGVAERVTVLQGAWRMFSCPRKGVGAAGLLFPSHARMWVAPVHSSLWEGRMGEFRSSMGDWRSFVRGTREDYGVDMAVLDQTYEAEQQKYFLQVIISPPPSPCSLSPSPLLAFSFPHSSLPVPFSPVPLAHSLLDAPSRPLSFAHSLALTPTLTPLRLLLNSSLAPRLVSHLLPAVPCSTHALPHPVPPAPCQTGCWESLYPSQVLGRPVMIREIDCATATVADVEEVKAHFTTRAFAADKAVNAIGGWFDVLFKGSATDPTEHEVQLTTAPSVDEGTHWGQQVFLLAHPLHVREGDEVSGAMHIRRSKKNHRLMDVDLQLQCQHTDGSRSPNTIAAYFIE
ncbi:unnamed protein product [Closterium sp. Naga37s-1]|nr:unnamed protein product [Closterium sp. Naga37s-1]